MGISSFFSFFWSAISSFFSFIGCGQHKENEPSQLGDSWEQLLPSSFFSFIGCGQHKENEPSQLGDSWEQLLPPDYDKISSQPEEGVIFSLDKSSGMKCHLSARKLYITWGDDTRYWSWISHPQSSFPELAELLEVWWLHIEGQINCRLLSPRVTYAAYLIFKLNEVREGLNFPSQETLVQIGNQTSQSAVCLDSHLQSNTDVLRVPHQKDDEWMELEMGHFFTKEGIEGNVRMCLTQVKTMNKKSGLIIQGIEVRPKKM